MEDRTSVWMHDESREAEGGLELRWYDNTSCSGKSRGYYARSSCGIER